MSQKETKDLDGDDYLVINVNDLKKLRVHELKEKLSEFGLNTKGTKAELINRLEGHLSAAAESEEELALIDVANNSQPSDSTENLEIYTPVKQANNESRILDISFDSDVINRSVTDKELSSTKEFSILSQEERIKARGQKFGAQSSDEAKKVMRLEKFGADSPIKPVGGDLEKMKQRGERFGENVSKKFLKMTDKDRQQLRKNRFSVESSPNEKPNKKIRLST